MKKGTITGEYVYSIDVDMTFDEVGPEDFNILYFSGGKALEESVLRGKMLILPGTI